MNAQCKDPLVNAIEELRRRFQPQHDIGLDGTLHLRGGVDDGDVAAIRQLLTEAHGTPLLLVVGPIWFGASAPVKALASVQAAVWRHGMVKVTVPAGSNAAGILLGLVAARFQVGSLSEFTFLAEPKGILGALDHELRVRGLDRLAGRVSSWTGLTGQQLAAAGIATLNPQDS